MVRPLPSEMSANAEVDDRPDTEPLHQGSSERRGQPVQNQVDRDGRRDAGARPPEIFVQRIDQHRWGSAEARRTDQRQECHDRDGPGAVKARRAHLLLA